MGVAVMQMSSEGHLTPFKSKKWLAFCSRVKLVNIEIIKYRPRPFPERKKPAEMEDESKVPPGG
jgi:hypothetical protein